jgi:Cof subfamily protein (haloacid dehalogenase superfamily)
MPRLIKLKDNYVTIVCDLDGTLLTDENYVLQENIDTLKLLQRQGHKLVLASGRPIEGMTETAKLLGMYEYGGFILSDNGARLFNLSTDEKIYSSMVDSNSLYDIFQNNKTFFDQVLLFKEGRIISDRESKIFDYICNLNKIKGEINVFLPKHFKSCFKMMFLSDNPIELSFFEQIMKANSDLSITLSSPFSIEITGNKVNKGSTLEKFFCNDIIVAFGNEANDLYMLENSNYSVTMKNGNPILHEIVDEITTTNNEPGISEVLNKLLI